MQLTLTDEYELENNDRQTYKLSGNQTRLMMFSLPPPPMFPRQLSRHLVGLWTAENPIALNLLKRILVSFPRQHSLNQLLWTSAGLEDCLIIFTAYP